MYFIHAVVILVKYKILWYYINQLFPLVSFVHRFTTLCRWSVQHLRWWSWID